MFTWDVYPSTFYILYFMSAGLRSYVFDKCSSGTQQNLLLSLGFHITWFFDNYKIFIHKKNIVIPLYAKYHEVIVSVRFLKCCFFSFISHLEMTCQWREYSHNQSMQCCSGCKKKWLISRKCHTFCMWSIHYNFFCLHFFV